MKVQSIKIQNIGNISALEKEVLGHNLFAVGKNGVGKSSVIDTLFEVLQGKYSKPNSVKKGEKGGIYEIDLGDWIANFTFKPEEKTASLKLTSKKGESISATRSTLSGVVGILDFDIDLFLGLSDSEKVKYLFKHINLGVSPEQLASIEKEREELYNERTIINRDVDLVKKTLVPPLKEEIELSKKEVKPVNELYDKKTKIAEVNQKIEYVENGLNERENDSSEIQKEIAKKENELIKLKDQLKSKISEISSGKKYLYDHKYQDPSEIDLEITALEEENEKIKEAKESVNRFNSLEKNLESGLKEQKEVNDKIAEIDDMKKNMIIDGLEIEGLDYDVFSDRFVFGKEKLSLNELNEAQRYKIGIQIGAKQLRNLRIMRFVANGLDNGSLKDILEFGKKNDIQFFVEMMDRNTDQLEIKLDEDI